MWRLTSFLLAVAVQVIVIVIALNWLFRVAGIHAIGPTRQIAPDLAVVNELSLLGPVLSATWLMSWLEDRPFTSYGLGGLQKRRYFGIGLAIGIALVAALIATLRATGYGTASPGTLAWTGDARFGLEWLLASALIGLTEELAFRGYLLSILASGTGFWPAALLTSALFGAVHGHNPGETYIGLVVAALFGVFCCLTIRRTGSLWLAIGLHGGWDYAENFLFGTRDSGTTTFGTLQRLAPHGNILLSGGATGPEGSLFCVLILLAAIAAFRFVPPGRAP